MKSLLRVFWVFGGVSLVALFSGSSTNNNDGRPSGETYSKVRIHISSAADIQTLQQNDIDIEHFQGSLERGIELVLSKDEMTRLSGAGLDYSVIIPDMALYYINRPPPSELDVINANNIMESDNVAGFSLGSMGGFYTYAEMIQKLDSMRLQYPTLITQKINIGSTHEARTIWAVKISDNPDVNESSTEAGVYFDALHHAREPASMQAMLYYMYWLLENYGSNPEATYLINNREIFFVPILNPEGDE